LFLGGVLSDLPEATLGCMVVVAVLGLIKPSEMARFWRLGRIEFWVMAITAVSGLCFGLLVAVAVGVILTLFLVIYELDRLGVTELQATPDVTDVQVVGAGTAPIDGLLILRVDGPLYTANVRSVNRRVLDAVDAVGPTTLVLDAAAVVGLPVTVLDRFADLQRELEARNVVLWVAALAPRALATAQQLPQWSEAVDQGRIFPTSLAAVRAYVGRPREGASRGRQ
jgi:MFS superfamily sulfate permease-like transporter